MKRHIEISNQPLVDPTTELAIVSKLLVLIVASILLCSYRFSDLVFPYAESGILLLMGVTWKKYIDACANANMHPPTIYRLAIQISILFGFTRMLLLWTMEEVLCFVQKNGTNEMCLVWSTKTWLVFCLALVLWASWVAYSKPQKNNHEARSGKLAIACLISAFIGEIITLCRFMTMGNVFMANGPLILLMGVVWKSYALHDLAIYVLTIYFAIWKVVTYTAVLQIFWMRPMSSSIANDENLSLLSSTMAWRIFSVMVAWSYAMGLVLALRASWEAYSKPQKNKDEATEDDNECCTYVASVASENPVNEDLCYYA